MISRILLLCVLSFALFAGDLHQTFEKVKKDPVALRDFLYRMPKGGDLHNHLDGSVYAESLIAQAARENMCIDMDTLGFIKPVNGTCAPNHVPASRALTIAGNGLYAALIRSISMYDFTPTTESPGQHFFSTFSKFLTLNQTDAEWAHEVVARAEAQNEQYMELMIDIPCDQCKDLSDRIKNPSPSSIASWDFTKEVAEAQQFIQDIENKRLSLGKSSVQVRYIFKAFRNFPNETTFPQFAFAFQLLDAESKKHQPLLIGFNIVNPESGYFSMKHYTDQMMAIGYLKKRYPNVHVSLHAGELTLGVVPPEDLTFHIHEAVHIASAERIGHGTDITYEKNNDALLKFMADNHVAVEIIPSSAKIILGVEGDTHPLRLYLSHHVPVLIATDDEGVARSDLTNEFQMAVEQHDLSYEEVKRMVRNSLEYSFLPGESVWIDHDYQRMRADHLKLITLSDKAALQSTLEKAFIVFEMQVQPKS